MEKLKDRTLVVIAIILGLVITALFYAKSVTAGELPDISESVVSQEAFEEKDLNHIALKEIEAPNKIFIGWTDSDKGDGKIYKAGDELDISQGIIIYPVWEDIIFKTGIDKTQELNSGKDLVLDTIPVEVGTNGLDISPEAIGFIGEIKNTDCTVNVLIDDIEVDEDIEAAETVLYPNFEDEFSKTYINVIYKLQAVHEGKIIGTSLVTLPIECTPNEELFEEEVEELAPTTVITDEAGNSYTLDY